MILLKNALAMTMKELTKFSLLKFVFVLSETIFQFTLFLLGIFTLLSLPLQLYAAHTQPYHRN